MSLLLIIKSALVIFFLLMFLRKPSAIWGIGLLMVTSAVLLDTFLGTFGREEMIADLGFFFYIISGVLFGSGAIWAWGVLRPLTTSTAVKPLRILQPIERVTADPVADVTRNQPSTLLPEESSPAYDQQMILEDIRNRFGREDVLDLMFDLNINENDVMPVNQDMNQLIINLMDEAVRQDQVGALALAVERILTPPPPEKLPRLEKINADSPPTIIRHYLLAQYSLEQLEIAAAELGVDWEQLGAGDKKDKVRNLLLYLYRRNRLGELIDLIHDVDSVG